MAQLSNISLPEHPKDGVKGKRRTAQVHHRPLLSALALTRPLSANSSSSSSKRMVKDKVRKRWALALISLLQPKELLRDTETNGTDSTRSSSLFRSSPQALELVASPLRRSTSLASPRKWSESRSLLLLSFPSNSSFFLTVNFQPPSNSSCSSSNTKVCSTHFRKQTLTSQTSTLARRASRCKPTKAPTSLLRSSKCKLSKWSMQPSTECLAFRLNQCSRRRFKRKRPHPKQITDGKYQRTNRRS